MNYETELAFAKDLAAKADAIAMQYYRTNVEFATKSDRSPVTIADTMINQIVIDAVKEQYPQYGVLGEEESWRLDSDHLFVCDPIDGTVDYKMGIPTFMFSIALVVNGTPVMAVTSAPAAGDTFWATSGNGAFLNGQPIHVSGNELALAWLVLPSNINVLTDARSAYVQLAEQATQTTIIHGAVFKGMLIAQGLADGSFWPGSVHPWDVAAVKLIVEEAGGKFTGIQNQEQRFDAEMPGGMVVSNGTIHNDMLQIINNAD